jgi:arylsulfatase A-like enzyme
MLAVVVTFDRLATRLLGCYGNEWIETPNFDRLASSSIVFDNHFADTVGPNAGRAWRTGRHALRSDAQDDGFRLRGKVRASGVQTRMIVADPDIADQWRDAGIDRVDVVRGHSGLDVLPNDVPFARVVQSACKALREPGFSASNRLLWLHVPEPGLPPEGFADLYFEDFEERGIKLSDVPREDWSRHLAVAAGSASLVDHWLGELLSEVDAVSRQRPTLVMIGAARGRSWMNDFRDASPSIKSDSPADWLRDQETKSPLILSIRNDERAADLSSLRCGRLVQPTDLLPTLHDWFGMEPAARGVDGRSLLREPLTGEPAREFVAFGDEGTRFGIRTGDWGCLMQLGQSDQAIRPAIQYGDEDWPRPVQLFVKPDDLWDVTDVSTQQPEVCERLVRTLGDFRRGL